MIFDFINDMWESVEIYIVKRKARLYYHDYIKLIAAYDCGHSMIDQITGGKASRYKDRFDNQMGKLRELDPDAPASRL